MVPLLALIFGLIFGLLLLFSAVTACRERQWRAFFLSVVLLVFFAASFSLIIVTIPPKQVFPIALVFTCVSILLIAASLLPSRHRADKHHRRIPDRRFDERDHMFARNALQFSDKLHRRYYKEHPQFLPADTLLHRAEELPHPSQRYHDSLYSPFYDAVFHHLDRARSLADGPVCAGGKRISAAELTKQLKVMARYYGAVDAGIAHVKPHHLYSHYGRRPENWGQPVETTHRFALVIAVAMEERMMRRAPALPVILESSRQYVEAAKIANLLAEFLRRLGFSARAHTDGNYQTLCVPLAVDAGLGELGRLGLLIHPRFGPSVRLSVVTSDAEMTADGPTSFGAAEFCAICKKCALNCPTRAIPEGGQPASRGAEHWAIDQEACYAYWKRVGTDCGFCIRVCPYTKQDNLFHRLVRWYVARNSLNRKAALLMDDLFYGRRFSPPKNNPPRGAMVTTGNRIFRPDD